MCAKENWLAGWKPAVRKARYGDRYNPSISGAGARRSASKAATAMRNRRRVVNHSYANDFFMPAGYDAYGFS
jgi:hypothetical protein